MELESAARGAPALAGGPWALVSHSLRSAELSAQAVRTRNLHALTATDLMLKSGLDALPVVDRSWKLLGVVTVTDLLRALRWMVAPATDGQSRSSA